jgi:N-carbamoylputrescine amidase
MSTQQTRHNDRVALALIQMSCSLDPAENLAKALGLIEQAAADGAELICLQELFLNRYPAQREDVDRFDWAEPIPGSTSEALGKLAKAKGVAIVGSIFEARAQGVYHNTAVVIDADGDLVGRYRKMHIPDDPLYHEKYYFTPGDTGFPAFDTRFAKVGPLVCWDQWFPEAARLATLAGAQVLVYPTAIGWQFDEGPDVDAAQHDAWETVQRAHAIANGVFVAAVNRVGVEDDIRFWGQSFVVDPFGKVIAKASPGNEESLMVECDLALIEKTRREWPFLRDRRIDAYDDLNKRMRDK